MTSLTALGSYGGQGGVVMSGPGNYRTAGEALDFTKHVRRIVALLALHPQLDAHYAATAQAAFQA